MKDSQLLSGAYKVASEKIQEYLQHGISEEDGNVAKLAMQTINSYSRLKAVENSEVSINLTVAKVLAQDQDELREYVRKGLPEVTGKYQKQIEN